MKLHSSFLILFVLVQLIYVPKCFQYQSLDFTSLTIAPGHKQAPKDILQAIYLVIEDHFKKNSI